MTQMHIGLDRPASAEPTDPKAYVEAARRILHHALDQLADRIAPDGVHDAAASDAWQCVCYEIAFASAELSAASVAVGSPAPDESALGPRLASLFAIEALQSALARLEFVLPELGIGLGALQAITMSDAFIDMRVRVAGAAALEAAGEAVMAADLQNEDFGTVGLDESMRMTQEAFRRFSEDVVVPVAEAVHRDDLDVPDELLGRLREMGVFGLSVPEAYGGNESGGVQGTLTMLVVTEALSEASLGAAGSLITRPEILARVLLAGGTEEQKRRWLPALASGNPLCAIAITEPDHGSDVAGLSLRATRVTGGWRLNGSKTWCTLAGKAGLIMVVARTHPDRALGHKGLSVFLVEKPAFGGHAFVHAQEDGGRLTGHAIRTIGYRGMHSFDLAFDDYFVADDRLVGEHGGVGRGFAFTMTGMVGGRLQTAARASGVMRSALRAAVRQARDRRVFGAALADYPLTRAKIARMAARFAACRRFTYHVGRLVAEGGGRLEASQAKLLACRSAEMLTREAMQIHGGMGYAEESLVSRLFVDARVLSIFEGAEETLALKVIARGLVEEATAREAREWDKA